MDLSRLLRQGDRRLWRRRQDHAHPCRWGHRRWRRQAHPGGRRHRARRGGWHQHGWARHWTGGQRLRQRQLRCRRARSRTGGQRRVHGRQAVRRSRNRRRESARCGRDRRQHRAQRPQRSDGPRGGRLRGRRRPDHRWPGRRGRQRFRQAGRQLDGRSVKSRLGRPGGSLQRGGQGGHRQGGDWVDGELHKATDALGNAVGGTVGDGIKAAGGAADDALVDKVKGLADDLSGKGVDAVAGKSDAASIPQRRRPPPARRPTIRHTPTRLLHPTIAAFWTKVSMPSKGQGRTWSTRPSTPSPILAIPSRKPPTPLVTTSATRSPERSTRSYGLSGSPPTHTDTATTTTTSGGAHAETREQVTGIGGARPDGLAGIGACGSSPAAIGTDHGGGFWDQAAHASNLQTAGVAGDHGSALSIMS